MKKITLASFFTLLITAFSFAQVDTIRLKSGPGHRTIVTDRAPQAIYFGLGGSGPIFSANYDRRFAKKLNGFGFTAGLGFFGATGVSIFSVPVSINYLFGKQNHFLELGAGLTYASAASYDFVNDGSSGSGSTIFEHINLGYRYQPATGGFFARVGMSPLFFEGEYITSYYLGFGYAF